MTEAETIIFVIDDEAAMREALQSLIRSVGLRVGVGVPHQPRPEAPACLVLDVPLPGLSGLDLQRELAAAAIHLPIIFITGHGDIR
jgi:FixJ family two-component response regulator